MRNILLTLSVLFLFTGCYEVVNIPTYVDKPLPKLQLLGDEKETLDLGSDLKEYSEGINIITDEGLLKIKKFIAEKNSIIYKYRMQVVKYNDAIDSNKEGKPNGQN